jgi:class 3 adenylate cyclase
MSTMMQTSQTPRAAAAMTRYIMESIDVRHALPLVHAPTLVLNNHNPLIPISHGQYIAEHVPGARFVELPGEGTQLLWDPGVVDEAAEFLTGVRPEVEIDRILTTVLFTDIVGSTARATELGDHRWRELRDAHNDAVRAELRRYRGREIDTNGDGFVASFDGPARAIRCARAIIDATHALGIELRAGLHTGECLVRGDDLAGVAVHIAARVGALAEAGEVLVSRTVVDLVAGSDVRFSDRGEHELKGVPDVWRLFAVAG